MTKGKTRIKICGITRIEDGLAAAAAGADAIGLVFYPKSARYVLPDQAAAIVAALPPFVDVVGLFVNATAEFVHETLARVPIGLLQFHGDEDETYCRQFDRPYMKAARVRPELDLVQYAASFQTARALLLDAFVDGYGGAGQVFDWNLIPGKLSRPIVLSGGLDPENVTDAIRRVRPAAVDVSSGVEVAKGVKDHAKIAAFIAGVRNADV
jgi:phosphoribosylanthranilate isomerase